MPEKKSEEVFERKRIVRAFPWGTTLREIRNEVVREAVKLCNGDVADAAKSLQVSPKKIKRWLEDPHDGAAPT